MKNKFLHSLSKLTALHSVFVLVGMSFTARVAAADEPYDTYNYDDRENLVYTPSAYEPIRSVAGKNLTYKGESIGSFVTPQDICYSDDGNLYAADTGNNRIVVLNNDMTEVVNIIDSFDNNGAKDGFKSPYGVCISENGQLYVADSQNHRIVVMEKDGTLVRIVDNPQSQSLDAGYVFVPLKVTVDYADRIYCIAQNMFEGIMVFETNGEFSGFFGTIDVKITLWEKFWKRIATKEERSKQQLYIPTEFTGIDVDADGFIYATNIDSAGVQAVRRLNPRGEDVIKKGENKNVGGEYGSLINEAIALRYDGDETLAVEKWREVLRLDENNELANIGIGKAYLTAGDNRNAMKYLKLGMDSDYYSIAFRRYRNQVLADNLSYIFTGIAVVIIAIVVIVRIRSRKHGKGGEKA